MDSKKVWATILIVLGVLFFLGGINGCYETSFYENEIESAGKMTKQYLGKFGHDLFNAEQYRGLILKEKIKNILILLLGIAGAISGTLMLRNSGPSKIIIYRGDELESESAKYEKFRL